MPLLDAHPIRPLYVWETPAIRRNLLSVEQLARQLVTRWPDEAVGTDIHRHAQIACLDVIEGRRHSSAARDAFVAAAEKAGIWGGNI